MGAAVRPMVWAGGLLLVAALVVYFVPSTFWAELAGGDGASSVIGPAFPASAVVSGPGLLEPSPSVPVAPLQAAASEAASASASAATQPLPASAAAAMANASAAAATPAAAEQPALAPDTVLLQAVQASWVEARDAQGRALVSRLVAAGEQVRLNGELPIRLVIGNAAGVELTFRQQRIDLPALTRDNVARLQLP